MTVLALNSVHHAYEGQPSVRGVSLSIGPGEIVCLLGPSGCGKSTLLRIAAGLERLTRGSIEVDGREVASERSHSSPEHRGVGMVFQDFALFPHLDVAANVAFGLTGRRAADRSARVSEVLRSVGMERLATRFPDSLSGGEQQRVALARAMAPEPTVLLLDEPFSGLDATIRQRVREETRRILRDSGTATLLVTHDGEEAMQIGDRIALMRDGELIQTGSGADLFFRPVDEFVAGFFGETNRLFGEVSAGRVRTPVGEISAPELPDGTPVAIVLRPEAIRPRRDPGGLATVVESRLLGGQRLTTLQVDGVTLQARHDASDSLESGARVGLELRPEMVHLFQTE